MGLALLLLHKSAIAISSVQEEPGSDLDDKKSVSVDRIVGTCTIQSIKWTGPESDLWSQFPVCTPGTTPELQQAKWDNIFGWLLSIL